MRNKEEMAEKKSPKKTFNPLLNASVTGATVEEFTQNAILCPAAKPDPVPILHTVPLNSQPAQEQNPNNSADINQELTNNQKQEFQQIPTYQPQPAYNQAVFPPPVSGFTASAPSVSDSNISTLSTSVLSSFSNILSFGNQKERKTDIVEESVDPNPNSVEHLLSSSIGAPNVGLVPFYSASTHGDSFALTGPSLSGPPLTGPAQSGTLKSTSRFRPKTPTGIGPSIPLSEPPSSGFSEHFVPFSGSPPLPSGLSRSSSSRSSPGLYAPKTYSPGLTAVGLSGPISGQSTPDLSVSGRKPPPDIPKFELIARPISPSLSRTRKSPGIPPIARELFPSNISILQPGPSSAELAGIYPPIYTGTSGRLTPPGLIGCIVPPAVPSTGSNATIISSSAVHPSESNRTAAAPPAELSDSSVFPPSVPGVFIPASSTALTVSVSRDCTLPPTELSGILPAKLPETSVPTVPPTVPKGPNNTYRRVGQKKIAYAPIPGLSSTPLQSVSEPQLDPNPCFPASTYDQPNVRNSAQKPAQHISIFSPPPVVDTKPSNLLVPSTDFNDVQSLDRTLTTFFPPVMSDIKSPNINPATLNSSATLQTTIMATPDARQTKTAATMNSAPYRPVYHHWFHRKKIEDRVIWQPFSMVDSLALEAAFMSADLSPENMVATDGGRYDVNILRRQRTAVYWESPPTDVRRCSWFYKTFHDGKFAPYKENIATKLEEEYKAAYELNQWHRKVELPNGETVVFHSPDVLVLFPQSMSPEVWNQANQTATKPRIVKRGMDEFDIDEGEPSKIDHLLFLCHGIGSVCDLKFRSVEEVVDDFRSISLQLVQSHYKSSCDRGIANRIEVLPVSWHNQLHSDDTGIDRKLKSITLKSIPRLRDFTNDTLLDILFYTSPIYCQTIISTVGDELNRIYALFIQRNPGFQGSVSLGGHSLGSLILFDILCHQHPTEKEDSTPDGEENDVFGPMSSVPRSPSANRRLSRRISYMMGAVGTGQPQLIYPHLNFTPVAFFALGSPIGMFVTVRGLESLGEQFALPNCKGFFNIFHPYDPVAYRIESLINPELANVRPVLIPHHKGRKRMHLELKETMARVGADLKQRVVESMKSTWNSVYQLAMFHRADNRSLEAEVDKVLKEQIASEESGRSRTNSIGEEEGQTNVNAGMLNNGRRVDYVLQEAPFEFFNEYIFALTSHVCYWESEDTMLLILKEIYNSMDIATDSQIPQQTMTIERSTTPSMESDGRHSLQMSNPTRPMAFNPLQGPPPTTSFIRKT